MRPAPWRKDWFDAVRPARRKLWRGVEAQHRVATMRLVDNLAEQLLLEQLIEASKPPLPPEAQGLHDLLGTPFRYASPFASRFREPHQPGIWYGAEDPHTVAAELAFWRWKFLVASDGLRDAQVVTEHTFFQARFAGPELDLTLPPWAALRTLLRHGDDYTACHQLARDLRDGREAPLPALRYESARREASTCHAVLDPRSLSLPAPHLQQTWTCKTTRHLVMFLHDSDALEYTFEAGGS